jgi:hypothetical protein
LRGFAWEFESVSCIKVSHVERSMSERSLSRSLFMEEKSCEKAAGEKSEDKIHGNRKVKNGFFIFFIQGLVL